MDEEKKKGLTDWVNESNFSVYQDPFKQTDSGQTQTDLITKIIQASTLIHTKKSLGDYIVVSPTIADILHQMDPKVKLRKSRVEKLEKLNKIWKKN